MKPSGARFPLPRLVHLPLVALGLAALAATGAVGSAAADVRAAATPSYTIRDLGRGVMPIAINENGDIAAVVHPNGIGRPVLISGNEVTPLMGLTGPITGVAALTDHPTPVITGTEFRGYFDGQYDTTAYVWKNGQVTWLRPLQGQPATTPTYAFDINNGEQVVGFSGRKAVVWGADRVARELYMPGLEDEYVIARAINDDGVIVGTYQRDDEMRACKWVPSTEEGGGFVFLTTLSWHALPETINNNRPALAGGRSVRNRNTSEASPVLWEGGNIVNLYPDSHWRGDNRVWDITDRGEAVGWAVPPQDGQPRAYLWLSDRQRVDLNDTIPPNTWILNSARGMNEKRIIIGHGLPSSDPLDHGFVLTPSDADTTAPVVTLTAPAAGATVSGAFYVSGGVTESGAFSWELLVDGAPANPAIGGNGTGSASIYELVTLAPGAHTLQLRARDAAGNTGTSDTRTITVTATPTVSLAGFLASTRKDGRNATAAVSVKSKARLYGFITLTAPAPAGGAVVKLAILTGGTTRALPDVRIAAGATKPRTPPSIVMPRVRATTTVELQATYPEGPEGVMRSVQVTVRR